MLVKNQSNHFKRRFYPKKKKTSLQKKKKRVGEFSAAFQFSFDSLSWPSMYQVLKISDINPSRSYASHNIQSSWFTQKKKKNYKVLKINPSKQWSEPTILIVNFTKHVRPFIQLYLVLGQIFFCTWSWTSFYIFISYKIIVKLLVFRFSHKLYTTFC